MPRPSEQPPVAPWHMIDEIDLMPLIAEHNRWQRLCVRLEAIADALPQLPMLVETVALRAQLRNAFPESEEQPQFPMRHLYAREIGQAPVCRLLDRLSNRRVALTVQTQDLIDMLGAEPAGRMTADTLGYMLRNVFLGCSESIGLELLALLFIAPQRLTAAARALLLYRIEKEEEIG